MATAYAAIPNAGLFNESYFIDRVEDRDGNVLISHEHQPTRAMSTQTACLASEILQHNVERGTGRNAQLGAQPAAGKTGTTDENTDTWFVGFTPYLATAVWMGFPGEAKSMGAIAGQEQFGGLYPARAWATMNRAYLSDTDKPVQDFPTCEPLARRGRPAAGAGDPYGTLNGGRVPSTVRPSTGTGGGGGGGGGTGTTSTTTPTTTAPPAPEPATPAAVEPGRGRDD
jgi:membrane peptidoglycan carboxypeptidase